MKKVPTSVLILKISIFVLILLSVTMSQTSFAKSKSYIYRSRANWVKLIKLSNKQLAGETLLHPYEKLNSAQIEGMLLGLNMNKNSLFKKEITTTEIFSIDEAKKFAPYITDALNQATANQVVNVAVVHKRPNFILQNDYFSMMNVFVTNEGVHFYFTKLFAKLGSDYQQASKMDAAISKAKSLRVTLDAGVGQKLAFGDLDEVIADPNYDFINNTHRVVPAETEYKPQGKKTRVAKTTTTTNSDTAARLKKLDELKSQKLITETEYAQKRKEILGEI